jgi:hypothetical protein
VERLGGGEGGAWIVNRGRKEGGMDRESRWKGWVEGGGGVRWLV